MLLSIYNISNTYTCLYVGIRHGDHSDLQRSFITIFYLLYYYVHSLSEINNIYLSIMSLCLTLCALVRSPTGFMIPAVAAVCVAYSTQVGVAIAFLTIGVGFTGVSRSGYAVNHVDIAPRYVLVSFRSLAAVVDGVHPSFLLWDTARNTQTHVLDVSSSCLPGHLILGRCVSTTQLRLYFTFVSTRLPFLSFRTPSDCPSPTIYTPLRGSRFVYDNKNP